MQYLRPGVDRRGVCGVDVRPRLDRERDMVQPRRVELELRFLERLPQPDRSRAGRRKAEIVDLLSALAVEERGLLEAERAEDRSVERQRAREVASHEIEVAEAEQHYRRMLTARATTIRPRVRLTAD